MNNINTMSMVHNSYYLYPSLSLPIRTLVDRIIGKVLSKVAQPVAYGGRVGDIPNLNLSVHIPSSAKNYKRVIYIASLRNHTDSQARSSNRPTVGGNGRNRIIAHNNAGNDTNRPAVVADFRVSPRSGMAESCL